MTAGRLLTIKDAAEYLGLSYLSAYRLVKNGHVPVVQFGDTRRYYVDRADLDALIARSKTKEAA